MKSLVRIYNLTTHDDIINIRNVVSNYEGIIDLQRKIPALFFKSFINTVCSKGFMNILFNNSSKSQPIIFSCEGDICYFLPS